MGKFIDITGQRFGRLTAIRPEGKDINNNFKWLCNCDCGNATVVVSVDLRRGKSKSCGCYKKEVDQVKCIKHRLSYLRVYRIWADLKGRCCNTKHKSYDRYGGRGITICQEWFHDAEAFVSWALSHGYRDDLTIDRKNNDKGYSPENCRWATMQEQARNTSANHLITHNGQTKCLIEWAIQYGLTFTQLYYRVSNGWPFEKAIAQPIQEGHGKQA